MSERKGLTITTLAGLYRQMSTTQLLLLQRAFELDFSEARDVATRRFCQRRLGLIKAELTKRGITRLGG